MLGVVIPAHNEEQTIVATLTSVMSACAHPGLNGEEVCVVVVLDSCTDSTKALVQKFDVHIIEANERNVGKVRSYGADHAIKSGARWLAFTDADTTVAHDWLVQQLGLNADAVCGTVGVADWSVLGHLEQFMSAHWDQTYTDRDGHRHIHGANLGVKTSAYLFVGGMPPLTCSEDVAFVEALERLGFKIVWSAAPRVFTSPRLQARAVGGFGDTLAAVASRLMPAQAVNL